MRKFILCFVVFVLPLITISFPASAAPASAAQCNPKKEICANQPCSNIGESTMDQDQKNLVVCLKDEYGQSKWRPMNCPGPGKGYGGTFSKGIFGFRGDGQSASDEINWRGCRNKNPLTGDCSCPPGFKEYVIEGFDNRDECQYYNSPLGYCGMVVFGCY